MRGRGEERRRGGNEPNSKGNSEVSVRVSRVRVRVRVRTRVRLSPLTSHSPLTHLSSGSFSGSFFRGYFLGLPGLGFRGLGFLELGLRLSSGGFPILFVAAPLHYFILFSRILAAFKLALL